VTHVIFDSGIFIASVFPDERLSLQATKIIDDFQESKISFAAPYLLAYELIAVTRKAVYQARITAEEGTRIRDILLRYPIDFHYDESLLKRAYELATEHNRPVAYDAQYLALMERLSCDFWTADERLYNAVKDKLASVKWLGNYS
jgi:predicted nucleic acid-binding protein